jgi:anti-anti-sigma factor
MNSRVKIVQLSGILDGISGGQLRRTIDEVIRTGSQTILVDCTAVEFMDSSGLGALVMALKQTRISGGRMVLCGINDQIKMLLELTDMDSVFEVFPTLEAFSQTALTN